MGRRRTKNKNLPLRLYLRRDGYYYRHPNGKEKRIAPPDDLALALVEWARFEGATLEPDATTFGAVGEQWIKAWPKTKKLAPRTQHDYRRHLDQLKAVFGQSSLDSITPHDVATYRDKRSAKTQGNREIAVLSIVMGWAREQGYTDKPNPCAGLRRNQESGRDVYMSDAVFDAIRAAGDATVRDAMDLARRTGMDVSVILQARRADVVGDELQLRRSKTGVPVRYRLREPDGELNELGRVVQDMLTRERHATGMRLVQDDKGQGVPYNTFSKRFDRARLDAGYQSGEYQFRDIRPKVATDQQDMQRAQDLLGHKHISTTERHYIRRGKLVDPAK